MYTRFTNRETAVENLEKKLSGKIEGPFVLLYNTYDTFPDFSGVFFYRFVFGQIYEYIYDVCFALCSNPHGVTEHLFCILMQISQIEKIRVDVTALRYLRALVINSTRPNKGNLKPEVSICRLDERWKIKGNGSLQSTPRVMLSLQRPAVHHIKERCRDSQYCCNIYSTAIPRKTKMGTRRSYARIKIVTDLWNSPNEQKQTVTKSNNIIKWHSWYFCHGSWHRKYTITNQEHFEIGFVGVTSISFFHVTYYCGNSTN